MAKKQDEPNEVEDKKLYIKKMRKLADDLSMLQKLHGKQEKKLASYEAELKKIDERLRDL